MGVTCVATSQLPVLRHPLLLHVPHGLVGVYTNTTMYTVSSLCYVPALCTAVSCWQCSISLVHGSSMLVGKLGMCVYKRTGGRLNKKTNKA